MVNENTDGIALRDESGYETLPFLVQSLVESVNGRRRRTSPYLRLPHRDGRAFMD
jgi:hypothetical protein